MPKEARELMRSDESLVSICLDLHMHMTGASDPIREEDFRRKAKVLEVAIECWVEGLPRYAEFDSSVRRLIEVVLQEYKAHNEQLEKIQFPMAK